MNQKDFFPPDKLNQFPCHALVLRHCHLAWKINITKKEENQEDKKKVKSIYENADEILLTSIDFEYPLMIFVTFIIPLYGKAQKPSLFKENP